MWEPDLPPEPADERALDFLAEHQFNFVRVPMDYRHWIRDFDYDHPDETVFTHIDSYVAACRGRRLHLSLNVHRAPGYCINWNHLEKHNLWLDAVAQDAFVAMWENFARRYAGIPADELSFDLVNEPPSIGQYGLTRENHAALIRRTVATIRAVDPQRPITIDGLGGGNIAMPELADLGATHSGRGYQPMAVSHYQAGWWSGHEGLPEPIYPNTQFAGHTWNRETLRQFYQPWREVQAMGVNIHIGEMGCYNKTPNDVALRWLTDLLGVYKELGWGFAFWNFEGDFGIVNHGRPGAIYERMGGFDVDPALLDVLLASRSK